MAGSGGADREEPERRACLIQVSQAVEKALQRNGAGKATEGEVECEGFGPCGFSVFYWLQGLGGMKAGSYSTRF